MHSLRNIFHKSEFYISLFREYLIANYGLGRKISV
jgi:hypothetical protein